MIGIPAVSIAMRNTIIKAPPPLDATIYGKRHILPKPTAEPIAANINPARVPHSFNLFLYKIYYNIQFSYKYQYLL